MFDAHVHIIDPRFPLIENEGYLPDPYTIADYKRRMSRFDIDGGAVVSGSFQGTDETFLRAALAELGDGWVGVINLHVDATDEEIISLDRAGVRALRFNLKRAGGDIVGLTMLALRAYELVGWHVELYIDGSMLGSLEPVISKLPQLSIDHLGMSDDCLPYLLNLVDRGAKVKASGFGRVAMDVGRALRRIHAVNPEALMFGSDLPGTRAGRPFLDTDITLITEAVGTDLHRVLEDNARAFYRLPAKERELADPAPTLPLFGPESPTLRLKRSELPKPAPGDTIPLPIIE
ncbi:Predicted metal-dependent hydrolase of the TIM-barrel fold [Nocardia otitidiscaviarum]|uniref:Predicted metal-dependent hydrolase of the TIM-barrel fold n=1 Tax=Nocardia otitidiscaviarum TaxID=1823 RepID=A0A378YAW0_9NOCA|nr:amidohydrolase family protein [Nocardia otitidiscaviarum]SUA73978.1 Predicted metal-dependent hydrolase of the TIM-barrel fold [Nocardia otitidiscaviarum]